MNKILTLSAFTLTLWSATSLGMGGPPPSSDPPLPSKYGHLDPNRYVPREALQEAVDYFDANQSRFSNKNYITVIDFSVHSGHRRFFVIHMNSGAVERYHTAHGLGSDPDHNGYANSFSNTSGSKKTSLGFYRTGSLYTGQHGRSMYLDGLSSTNSRARERAIVIHPADYVGPGLSKMGRSWGCPALDPEISLKVISRLRGGSLIYAWAG